MARCDTPALRPARARGVLLLVLPLVLCARLAAGDTHTGKLIASPAPKAKKEAFAAEIKSHLQRSNEEYEASAGAGAAGVPGPGARRRAAPAPRPPAPPRDLMWRQEGGDTGHVIQQSSDNKRPGPEEMQLENQRDFEREAREREKVVVEIERDDMVEGRQNRGPNRTPQANVGREKVRGEESQMILEQSLWVTEERERVGPGHGVGKRGGAGTPEWANEAAAADNALMGAPHRETAQNSRGSRRPATTRAHERTVARAFRGVRMTLQGVAEDEDPSGENEESARNEAAEAGAADTTEDVTEKEGNAVDAKEVATEKHRDAADGENEAKKGDESGEGAYEDRERVGGDREGVEGDAQGNRGGEGDKTDKVERLRNFLRNNKDMLKKFILEKRKQRQLAAGAPPPTARPLAPASPMTFSTTYTPMTFHPPRAAVGPLTGQPGAAGGLRAGGGALRPGATSALPPLEARMLDMAPARGSRVIAMRDRGRLCQRNVLMPEGPKYDSKGAVYLLAYNRTRYGGRDYTQTKAPQLLLPACCNCCKKSVLGCE